MKKVLIEIMPDGASKVDAQGFQGQSCALATREIELALAGTPDNLDDRKKPDFYATTGQHNTQRS